MKKGMVTIWCEASIRHHVNQTPSPDTPPPFISTAGTLPPRTPPTRTQEPCTPPPRTQLPRAQPPRILPAAVQFDLPTTNTYKHNIMPATPMLVKSLKRKILQLILEPWFHGPMSRATAEKLLVEDGDFLVRESLKWPGEILLSVRGPEICEHLLLVDLKRVMEYNDFVHKNVPHMINYHHRNKLPIIFNDCTVILRKPVTHA